MVSQFLAVLTALTVLALPGQAPGEAPGKAFSSFLVSGERAYVKMRDVYIASYGTGIKWSRDSKTLLLQTDSEPSRARERRRSLQEVGEIRVSENTLLRYTVENGEREILYRVSESEVLEDRIFVGSGADVLFSVYKTDAAGNTLRRLYFAPASGPVRTVGPPLDARIPPSLLASQKQPRALMAITTPDKRLEVFLISAEASRLIEVPGEWQFGQLTDNPKSDTVRLVASRLDEKERATTKTFDIDYATGAVSEVLPDSVQNEPPEKKIPLFRSEFYRVARVSREQLTAEEESPPAVLKSDSNAPLRDLDFLENGPRPRRLAMARSIEGYAEHSPDGLKVVYQTAQGFFLGELVPLSPKMTKAKQLTSSP